VSCLSRDYASLFNYEGARTDKHVRAHEVYAVGGQARAARRVAETALRMASRGGLGGWILQPGPLGFQRSALEAAPLLFVLLVGSGLALRPQQEPAALEPLKPTWRAPKAPATAPSKPAVAPAPQSAPATAAAKPAPAAPASKPAAPATGRVRLAITPWGAVYVDGERVGVSPPLRTLELEPGTHQIEIRNTSFPRRVETVEVKAGGEASIRHRFR